MPFAFTLRRQLSLASNRARAGEIETDHGRALTPMFMAVGTLASVKSLDSHDIKQIRTQFLLANTYHLYLRPGPEVIAKMGGVHNFMGYDGPMLTDSGGFQVFSLGAQLAHKNAAKTAHSPEKPTNVSHNHSLVNQGNHHHSTASKLRPAIVTDEGVTFTSHLDGQRHFLTPELSITTQQALGADIIMAFDECVPDQADRATTARAVERTHAWLQRCVHIWEAAQRRSQHGHYQALFGIVQGGQYQDLRATSLQHVLTTAVDGIALGGETIGYNMPATVQIMSWLENMLPGSKPRYAMGLGRDPQNVIDAVCAGFDMFDCVAPTRLARNGALYVGELDISTADHWYWRAPNPQGRLNIGNAQYRTDSGVIQSGCDCYTCQSGYTRAYLHHLYRSQELTYYRLASIHNVRTMVRLTAQLRQHILSQ